MRNYFSLISNEFESRTQQIYELIKHRPTIGALHEELLKEFLQKYLPKFLTVSSGFILDKEFKPSTQIDILIYNSSLYSPLYSVGELVVLPPEAVFAIIEVKANISSYKELDKTISKLDQIISAENRILKYIFTFKGLVAENAFERFKVVDFSSKHITELPRLFSINNFYVTPTTVASTEGKSVAYFYQKKLGRKKDFVFESFYRDIYDEAEKYLNSQLKSGIKVATEFIPLLTEDGRQGFNLKHHGRKNYVGLGGSDLNQGNMFTVDCKL